MESEVLAVFDGDHRRIGTATRDEVHRQGHWHEAFQCWFIKKEEGIERIYLQLRSTDKKDHPNLLDITAAGHLLATETVMDGIREIQEEIGVDVAYDDLIPLGVQKYTMTKDGFIDNEFAHVFLYPMSQSLDDFVLQPEEVSGMFSASVADFASLWLGTKDKIPVHGFRTDSQGKKVATDMEIGITDMVPHPVSYYRTIIDMIQKRVKQREND
ncbi:NUDIX domain-containing protein [Paenibacillus sp. JCM 10914]